MASVGKPQGNPRRRYVVDKEAMIVTKEVSETQENTGSVPSIFFMGFVAAGLCVWLFADDWRYFVVGALTGVISAMIAEVVVKERSKNARS